LQCVYLKALQIAYAEDLLQAVKDEFGKMFKDRIEDRSVDFGKHFDVKFDELLERAPAAFGAVPLRGQHTSARSLPDGFGPHSVVESGRGISEEQAGHAHILTNEGQRRPIQAEAEERESRGGSRARRTGQRGSSPRGTRFSAG
jgi:hypothetical protein